MNPKKKIVHIIQSLDNGGCENMLLRTLPAITEFEHVVICLHSKGTLAPQFADNSIRVLCPHYKSLLDISGLFRLNKIIKQENPVLVITYLFHADVVGRIFLPLFIAKNISIIPFLRTTYNDSRYRIARFFEKYTRFLVKKYFANSEAVKAFYVQRLRVPANRIVVIPNGIDTTLYDKTTVDTHSLQCELTLPENARVITCVANLHPNKGHYYLLEAFIAVAKNYPEVYLLLAGDGIERARLETQAKNSPYASRILFLGRRKDIREILALSHLFVFPTFFEGLSNALQEAMSMSLPIIATNIPENKILLHENVNAILVPPRSCKSLKKAIQKMLNNPDFAQKTAAQARKTIVESYSLETAKKCFVKAIEQTL